MKDFVPHDVKQRVEEKIQHCLRIAERQFNKKFNMPSVAYDLSGVVAGYAYLDKWAVKFNHIFLKHYEDKFIERTVPHEVAHLVCSRVYPNVRAMHGAHWKSIMHLFGAQDATRCHDYDLSVLIPHSNKYHKYVCNKCGKQWTLAQRKHEHVQTRKYILLCSCRAVFKPDWWQKDEKQSVQGTTLQKGSKFEQCYAYFKQHQTKCSKDEIIKVFITSFNMTPAGATTYFYKCRALASQ